MSMVRFNANGEAVFIYEDGHPCLDLGRVQTKRASHVEPTENGLWCADMSPIDGPLLEETRSRKQSVSREHQWISENRLNR